MFLISGFLGLLSFFLTYMIRHLAIRHKILDIPSDRSSHETPTPRGGGLAVVISWYAGITLLFFLNILEKELYYALLTGILLAIISLLDDMFSLKPFIRMLIQFITAVVSLFLIGGMGPVNFIGYEIMNPYILYPLTILGIIWFINLYNFLDGIDAYASVEAIFIAAGMFIFVRDPVLIVLMASILGFLYWNWPKAKIFMGDVGSTQLGFVLIILGIYYHNTTDFEIIYWIMLSSLFWFDATLTLFRRLRNREKLSQAHKKHAYQRIVQAGFSHAKTVYFSLLVNGFILAIVSAAFFYRSLLLPALVLTIILLYILTKIVDTKVPFNG